MIPKLSRWFAGRICTTGWWLFCSANERLFCDTNRRQF